MIWFAKKNFQSVSRQLRLEIESGCMGLEAIESLCKEFFPFLGGFFNIYNGLICNEIKSKSRHITSNIHKKNWYIMPLTSWVL